MDPGYSRRLYASSGTGILLINTYVHIEGNRFGLFFPVLCISNKLFTSFEH